MTAHINPYRSRALWAPAIVNILPFLQNGVQLLPVVLSLEAERLGERCRA